MNEHQIIDAALLNLQEKTPFRGVFVPNLGRNLNVDGTLKLSGQGVNLPAFNIQVRATVRQHLTLQLIDMANSYKPFMIVAEKIFPAMKEELRKRNVNYMDGAGNVFISEGKTFLWMDGQRAPALKKTVNKAFTKTGLKVVFYFLHRRNGFDKTYREIAQATGVALGNINNVIHGLNEAGFLLPLNKKNFKLLRNKQLLDRWITGYGDVLRPTLLLGNYRFWIDDQLANWKNLHFPTDDFRWGGEPAADLLIHYLQPQTLTIYTETKAQLVREWNMLPDDQGPVQIYRKFWHDDIPDMTTNIAPVLLIYADLILSNDPRCIETANRIYQQYLKDEFETNQGR